MRKRLHRSRPAPRRAGGVRLHPHAAGLTLATLGGFFASDLVFCFFDFRNLMNPWLALSADGLRAFLVHQPLTYVLVPGSCAVFLAGAISFYLAAREVEPKLGPARFSVLLVSWVLIGGLAELALSPASIVCGSAPLGVGVLTAFCVIFQGRHWKLPRFTVPFSALGGVAACVLALLAANQRVVPGASSPGAFLAPLAALALVALFTAVFLRFQGFGRPTAIECAMAARRLETLRMNELSARAFIAEFVDPILDKISTCGMRSLTRWERRILKFSERKLAGAASKPGITEPSSSPGPKSARRSQP